MPATGIPLRQLGRYHRENAVCVRENPDAWLALEPDDFAGGSRNPEAERGVPVLGFDVDRPVVRDHDLLDDVEAEPEAFSAGGGGAAPERIEDRGQQLAGNGAGVADVDAYLPGGGAVEDHVDRTIGVTVPQRVANQIRGHLGQAVGVPLPGDVAVGSDEDATIRENRPVLLDYPLDQRPEVSGLALQRDAAGQA